MFRRTGSEWRTAARGGLIAGLWGGLALSLFMMLTAWLDARDVWQPLKGAASPFLGLRARVAGFDAVAVLVGQLAHFAVSMAWGLLFGLLVYGISKPTTVWLGLLWGLVVASAMFYVVLPLAGLGAMARASHPNVVVLQHLLFGLTTAVGFLPYQRSARHPLWPQVES